MLRQGSGFGNHCNLASLYCAWHFHRMGCDLQVFDGTTGKSILGLFRAHPVMVTSLVFTLDGQQIITASSGFIRVWDAVTGHEVGNPTPANKDYRIDQIALNPDGRRIASVSRDRTVCVWDLTTRRQIGDSLQPQLKLGFGIWSVAWSPDGRYIVAGDGFDPTVAVEGSSSSIVTGPDNTISNILLWDVPPLEDISVPVLFEGKPPLLSTGTSQSRPASLGIFRERLTYQLPVASPSTPFLSSGLNGSPGEDVKWQHATNDSFDSLLDLPADGTQPAQRRKRWHGRGAPIASTSLPPIPNKAPALYKQQTPTPDVHTASRTDSSLPWTRDHRKIHKNCDERQERQPNHPTMTPIGGSETPSKSSVPETKTSNTAPNTSSPSPLEPSESSSFASRVRARFRRGKHDPESIKMNPRSRKTRLPNYSRVAKVPHAQADARLVIAPPRRKHRPCPVATAAVQEQGHEQGQGESQEESAVQAQETATAQSQELVRVQGTVQNQGPGQGDESEEEDSEDEAEEQEDDAESFRDDGCLNAICFCEYLKWLKYRREQRRQRDD
ncbi:hypothetical protein BJ138DRAFT_645621 [Hygrophoropsis aurantiaca]|uniref:Uncharacterized protein n=1 Tax=Hygrophoropsis aurantiaca TaxID=72124 RepID=A0ACB8A012_9AGAM|nr:hypothetical protein BJ138DRAFT_645621 [Hygrophoropsis aurantiaca]